MIYAYIQDGKHQQVETAIPPNVDWWIRFDDADHSYQDSNGVYYKSCTTFVRSMEDKPFCSEKIAVECASQRDGDYAGMTPQEIMARWSDMADAGTELHAAIEASIKGTWRKSHSRRLDKIVQQFDAWRNLNLPDLVKSERIFWSKKYHIAGMFDIVAFDSCDGATIHDVKTYKSWGYSHERTASNQITLGCMMLEEMLVCKANVGGVILYENYYKLRSKCRLQYKPCKNTSDKIRPHLDARRYRVRHKEEDMALKLTGGVLARPKRVVVYGTEGVGKSTFASRFPNPAFLDVEGSTSNMDVQRLEAPSGWNGVLQTLKDIYNEPKLPFKTLVIDTFDWLERAGATVVAKGKNKKSLADIGYGKGEVALASEVKDVLDGLTTIQEKHAIHIALVCHAWVKHFDPPDLPDGFDRYELKLTKHVAPLVREWCDILIFANFVSKAKETDGKNKGVGDGSERRMYFTRTDAHDAKNRFGLDAPLPFAYKNIAHVIEGGKEAK